MFKIELGSELQQMASGVVGLNKLTFSWCTSDDSIPMLPQTDTHIVTENMRWRRSINMNRTRVMEIVCSGLIYTTCFVSNGKRHGQGSRHSFFIRDWPPAWLQNGTSHTVPLCPGYNANLSSRSFSEQSNASGGSLQHWSRNQVPAWLHLWTWLSQRQTLFKTL